MEEKPDRVTVNLDEEFKAGLNTLRPFILRLSSVEDAKLTRLWLEKLHDSLEERKLRNIFLRELTEQVQAGKLRFPFNKPPPVAPLYLCQDGGGEELSSTDSYSGSSKYFHPRGDSPATTIEKSPNNWNPDVHGANLYPTGQEELRHRRGGGKSWGRLLPSKTPIKRRLRLRRTSSSKSHDSPEDVHGLLTTISSLQTRNEALAQEIKLYQETATKTQKNLESVEQEVTILKNKLDGMRAINTCIEESNTNVVNDYRKALTESVKRLSERLDVVSKRNVNLEEKVDKLKWEKKARQSQNKIPDSEMKVFIKKLKGDLDTERRKRALETHALKKLLAQKENQVDSHVQTQCEKMQKEVTFMKHEIDRSDQQLISPSPKFKEKISGLRKHVYHVEKTNKKILGVFERKLNQYKEECDRKGKNSRTSVNALSQDLHQDALFPVDMQRISCDELNFLHQEVETKDRLASSLQTSLKKAEAQYRKHITELQESCKAQRTFDHQRIAALEERLRNRLFD